MQCGIQIHDSVTEAYEAMKIRKPRAGYTKRKFLRLCISDDDTYIVVDKEIDSVQQTSQMADGYLCLLSHLHPEHCCFIIYDVSYETKDSLTKEDLVLIQWCPDAAETKEKVQYSMTQKTLKNKLKGFKAAFEFNSLDDLDRSVIADKLGNDILKVEGVNV
ncbi:cofilin-2-like [Heptranchias perlo]|uniref:cofilin-2-like n=1 Tax=Heptranchias perlo TaxID=212740 RepID=UPI003559BBEF